CRTKVCEQILTADTRTVAFIETLEALGPRLPDNSLSSKAVLFPCTDMSVLLLSRHRHRVESWYHIMLPAPEVVEMLMDKISFYTYAQTAGLPIPGTFLLRSREDATQAAAALSFPCILKPPLKSPEWQQNTNTKVYKVASAQEFLALY